MTKTELEANLDARAQVFKALGHPVRLMIINLVKIKPRHGEELAEILRLQPATISHHLGALAEAGLLRSQKDQYYQTYSLVEGMLEKTLAEMVHLPQPGLAAEVEVDAYRQKVLSTFFKRGRLVQIPAQLKKFQIVMEHIAQEFEPGRQYTEQEVNKMLVEYNEDVASLRRGLIEIGLMERAKGIYWRK
jgi:DNA-binding HxlR family transcriptional regulator